ncbi:hypothetical protein ACFY12_01950 [Streptomyces sp. NPDC001339]|uniref:hypothetical protein n=1 Tax=Streptomyces sp. NPDC001339 TaxID=3364563 RepID=UPI00368313E2
MPLGNASLRRRCHKALEHISPPYPFSLSSFCRQVAERRGRPLHLHPLPQPAAVAGACGLWLATDAGDHIFFEQRTTRVHQEHIVLHEIGHMLFDHYALAPDSGVPAALLPDLDPRVVRQLLARTNYTSRQEREAELLASMIRTGEHHADAQQPRDALDRIRAALGVRPV